MNAQDIERLILYSRYLRPETDGLNGDNCVLFVSYSEMTYYLLNKYKCLVYDKILFT